MNSRQKYIAFMTIFSEEVRRSLRTWKQTFLPAIITTVLYFLIFGTFIGSQISSMGGVSYMSFIIPGLVMMAVLQNSFQSMLSKFYFLKWQKTIQEILISPMPAWLVVFSYISASVFNGFIIGVLVFLSSYFFESIINLKFKNMKLLIFFALLGLINAIYAKTFDDIGIVQTFVITPLTYLGGVFYSITLLPDTWQMVSHFNPILYMISAFRYSILGFSDISLMTCMLVICTGVLTAFSWVVYLFKTGRGLKA